MAENTLHELRFVNSDATPKTVTLHVSRASVAPIMSWYGAFFAGDRYTVLLDGERLEKDRNGDLIDARIALMEQSNG